MAGVPADAQSFVSIQPVDDVAELGEFVANRLTLAGANFENQLAAAVVVRQNAVQRPQDFVQRIVVAG